MNYITNKIRILKFLIFVRLNRFLSLIVFHNSAGMMRNLMFKPLPKNKHVFKTNEFINHEKLNSYKDVFYDLLSKSSDYENNLSLYNLRSYDTINQGEDIKTHFYSSTRHDLTVVNKSLHVKPNELPFLDVVDFDKLSSSLGIKNSNIVFTRVDLWRNYTLPKDRTEEAYSNFWHMDRFGRNYLRLFCLLSHCTSKNGPFHYLSYEDSIKLSKRCKKLRKHDNDIPNSLRVNTFTGNYGDSLACNTTTIWHKAGNVETDFRDMLAITFYIQ